MYIKIIQVICNMGYQNTSIINLHAWDYGLLGVLNVTERNHWMTLNTAFIHTYNIHYHLTEHHSAMQLSNSSQYYQQSTEQ